MSRHFKRETLALAIPLKKATDEPEMMNDSNNQPRCPFRHPREGEVFYTSELVKGVWDTYPANPGHALIVPHRHVARDLIAHEKRHLLEQLPEVFGRRFLIPHQGQLVEDQRVIEDVQVWKGVLFGHGGWRGLPDAGASQHSRAPCPRKACSFV